MTAASAFSAAHPALARALDERDYREATPVQRAVLQADARGRDLLVSAQTGSGKTIAYGLAIAELLLEAADGFGPAIELVKDLHRRIEEYELKQLPQTEVAPA